VMIFTAISYGKMVQIFPDAGSAYSYTRKPMGEYPGFFVCWAALLDYLLLSNANALIIRIYMDCLFPHIAFLIWVIVYVIAVTGINIYSMKSTSSLNLILFGFTLILMVVFMIIGCIQLYNRMETGNIFTLGP